LILIGISPVKVLTRDHPGATSVPTLESAAQQAMPAAGIVERAFGVKLPGLVASLGVVDVDHAGHVTIERGGCPWGRQAVQAFELMEPILRGKAVDEETWQSALAAWQDPAFRWVASINYGTKTRALD
jgi:hypothetical protein